MACSSICVCVRYPVCFSGSVQRQISKRICNVILQGPSSLCLLHISNKHPERKYALMPPSRTNSCSFVVGSQAFPGSFFKHKSKCNLLTVRSNNQKSSNTCLDISLGSDKLNLRLSGPRKARTHWSQCTTSVWLFIGLLSCYSSSEPVHADALEAKDDMGDHCDSSSVSYSHGKKVYTDYSVTGIPGDGRCLFRSVARGACLRAGKPAPNESLQRELADELRAKVANEFVKRRKETEWFIEGDFDTYIRQMRKPHVWGGEPELLMASHVLQMPITVYMHDQDSGGLIAIAEYGQEYGKDNPIRVLYNGFGHYDALQIPGNKGARPKL